jgi:hypothetical protein
MPKISLLRWCQWVSLGEESKWEREPLRLHRLQHRILGLPLRWLCMTSDYLKKHPKDPLKLKLSGHVRAAPTKVLARRRKICR